MNDSYAGVIGGTFSGGKFTFYVRGRFQATDKVELEGLDGSNVVVVAKQLVEIISATKDLILTIDGNEQTETYVPYMVQELTQSEYLALAEKDPAVVYAVQPDDPESDKVYFLGGVPVDLVKSAEGLLYNRNLLNGATSEWKDFSISGWTAEPHRKEISELGLSVGDKIVQSIELDNNNPENLGGIRSFIAQYDESNTLINQVSGETIAVGETGISTISQVIAGNTIEVAISIGHSINTHTDTGRYRKRKISNGTNGEIGNFTVAPEDILGNANLALSTKNTVAEIKAFLDEQGIKYKSNANKATLLSLTRG